MNISLQKYIIELHQQGRNCFTKQKALVDLGYAKKAFEVAASRLVKQKKLFMPKSSFYVIIPQSHQNIGFIDPYLYLNSMMRHLDREYYVAILSAAQKYGATHHQPQVIQVITRESVSSVVKPGLFLSFHRKHNFPDEAFIHKVKTDAGYFLMSSPELTLVDLIRYQQAAGGINNVYNILYELQDQVSPKALRKCFNDASDAPSVQRLGYMLSTLSIKQLSRICFEWLQKNASNPVPLRMGYDYEKSQFVPDWNLYVNEQLELDV